MTIVPLLFLLVPAALTARTYATVTATPVTINSLGHPLSDRTRALSTLFFVTELYSTRTPALKHAMKCRQVYPWFDNTAMRRYWSSKTDSGECNLLSVFDYVRHKFWHPLRDVQLNVAESVVQAWRDLTQSFGADQQRLREADPDFYRQMQDFDLIEELMEVIEVAGNKTHKALAKWYRWETLPAGDCNVKVTLSEAKQLLARAFSQLVLSVTLEPTGQLKKACKEYREPIKGWQEHAGLKGVDGISQGSQKVVAGHLWSLLMYLRSRYVHMDRFHFPGYLGIDQAVVNGISKGIGMDLRVAVVQMLKAQGFTWMVEWHDSTVEAISQLPGQGSLRAPVMQRKVVETRVVSFPVSKPKIINHKVGQQKQATATQRRPALVKITQWLPVDAAPVKTSSRAESTENLSTDTESNGSTSPAQSESSSDDYMGSDEEYLIVDENNPLSSDPISANVQEKKFERAPGHQLPGLALQEYVPTFINPHASTGPFAFSSGSQFNPQQGTLFASSPERYFATSPQSVL